MKRKLLMTVIFIISLSTMLMNWFGGQRGVQDISGLILLNNPIAVACIILTLIGIWTHYGETSYMLIYVGLTGIMMMEIYEFLTWHIFTISGSFNLALSFDWCNPEFYIAVMSMIATLLIYRYYFQKMDLTKSQDYV